MTRLFVDHCVNLIPAESLAHTIRRVGWEVVFLREEFGIDVNDADWIPEVSSWSGLTVVITADRAMKRDRIEKRLLNNSNMIWLFLLKGWQNRGVLAYSSGLFNAWPGVQTEVEKYKGGTRIFSIRTSGKLIPSSVQEKT